MEAVDGPGPGGAAFSKGMCCALNIRLHTGHCTGVPGGGSCWAPNRVRHEGHCRIIFGMAPPFRPLAFRTHFNSRQATQSTSRFLNTQNTTKHTKDTKGSDQRYSGSANTAAAGARGTQHQGVPRATTPYQSLC